MKHAFHTVPSEVEKILETKNIRDALEYLKKRQGTTSCKRLIKMIEDVFKEQQLYYSR